MSGMFDDQISVFPDQLKLLRFEPDAGRARYVFLTILRDLFGGAMLVACRKACNFGSVAYLVHFEDYDAATRRALSRSVFARPYIWRFSVLSESTKILGVKRRFGNLDWLV